MADCKACDCALISMGAKGIAKLFREHADDLIKPLTGVGRDSQIRDTQALVEAAKEMYTKAKSFTEGKQTPLKHGQFLGSGVAGTIDWNLDHFDRIAEEAVFTLERGASDAPLEKFSKIVNELGEGFEDLSGRLAASCSIDKNLI